MAIIKFGISVVGARGTVGGLIFSANKSGPYFRSWSKSANPRTPLQSTQRGQLSDFASAWADLTDVQHDDWDDYADDPAQELTNSLGIGYFISGFNWYVRINLHLQANGDSPRDDAPTTSRPAAPGITVRVQQRFFTTGSATNSAVKFGLGTPEIAKPHVVFCRITSQGRIAIASGFTLIKIAIPDGGGRVTIQTELESRFGTILADTRLHIFARVQETEGQRGPSDSQFKDVETD